VELTKERKRSPNSVKHIWEQGEVRLYLLCEGHAIPWAPCLKK
jgi:hypothetical protein